MHCLPGDPHLTVLSFSPSLLANIDGLHHLALSGWGLEVEEKEGVVKFTESVELDTVIRTTSLRKKKTISRQDAAVTFS